MKKLYASVVLIWALSLTNVFAQSVFTKTIGENWEDEGGLAILANSDGTIIIAGWTESITSGWRDAFLVKTTSTGDTIWTKHFGVKGYDEFADVIKTSDGGYAMVGRTWDTGTSDSDDIYLVKTDANGNLEWQMLYGGSEDENGYALQQTQDGGYIVTGSITVTGGAHILLLKTNAAGDTTWTKTFQDGSYGEGEAIIELSTGDLMVFGYRANTMYLMKTDANGDSIWSQEYPDGDYGLDMKQTSDGGFILLGYTNDIGAGDYDFYLVKTDANGVSQWAKTYGGVDYENAEAVIQTSDGGYALIGSVYNYPSYEDDLYLIKTNGTGDIEWQVMYGTGVYDDRGFDLAQAPDGGILAVGSYTQPGTFYTDVYLIKEVGSTSIDSKSKLHARLVNVAPNPFTERTTLTLEVDSRDIIYVELIDLLGEMVQQTQFSPTSAGRISIGIERNELPQGFYFFNIRSNKEAIASGKLTIH